jgi:hypothetical protein
LYSVKCKPDPEEFQIETMNLKITPVFCVTYERYLHHETAFRISLKLSLKLHFTDTHHNAIHTTFCADSNSKFIPKLSNSLTAEVCNILT